MNFNSCRRENVSALTPAITTGVNLIIFWDTCGLLDIYNDAVTSMNGSHVDVLQRILRRTNAGEILNFSSDLLEVEFTDNLPSTLNTLNKKLNEVVSVYNNISSISEKLNPYTANKIAITDNELNILPNLDHLIQNFIDKIILIDKNEFLQVATDRHVLKQPPGHHGFKDCIFWLNALEIRNKLGNSIPCYFITNNTKDYFEGNNVHPFIVPEATTAHIEIKRKILDLYSII